MGRVQGDRRHKKRDFRQDSRSTTWSDHNESRRDRHDSGQWSPLLSPAPEDNWSQLRNDLDLDLNSNFPDFQISSDLASGLDFAGNTTTPPSPQPHVEADCTNPELPELNLLTPEDSALELDLGVPGQEISAASSSVASPGDLVGTGYTAAGCGAIDIVEWTTQLSDLNAKLTRSPLPLDEVLSANSTLLKSIQESVRRSPGDSSRISMILFAIICLSQCMTLFEQCVHSTGAKSLFNEMPGPALLLGTFQVDLESQHKLQAQIVCKELMRTYDVAKRVKDMVQRHGGLGGQSRTHVTLLEDVQRRVRGLVHVLKQR